jgi:hypothetical protein
LFDCLLLKVGEQGGLGIERDEFRVAGLLDGPGGGRQPPEMNVTRNNAGRTTRFAIAEPPGSKPEGWNFDGLEFEAGPSLQGVKLRFSGLVAL